MHATLHTNHGDIRVELFENHAPKTVANFTGLASGEKEWTDPTTGATRNDPFFDGLAFHRVIDGFMVQTGDRLGTGTGGPGYTFGDEFHPALSFNRPYLLAMANAGPGTNGSQFFLVYEDTQLAPDYTVFGTMSPEGLDVVKSIAAAGTAGGADDGAPATPVTISDVTVG